MRISEWASVTSGHRNEHSTDFTLRRVFKQYKLYYSSGRGGGIEEKNSFGGYLKSCYSREMQFSLFTGAIDMVRVSAWCTKICMVFSVH